MADSFKQNCRRNVLPVSLEDIKTSNWLLVKLEEKHFICQVLGKFPGEVIEDKFTRAKSTLVASNSGFRYIFPAVEDLYRFSFK